MNEFDHYVNNVLGIQRYARYVDDFIILNENSDLLKDIARKVSLFCKDRLALGICVSKTILQETDHGIDFLGYFIKPTHTLVRRKVIGRFKYKFFKALDDNGFVSIDDLPMIKSYTGHFSHAHSYGLLKRFSLIKIWHNA